MRRLIVSLALALMMVVTFVLPAFATDTADVNVTATPEYVAMTNTGGDWTIGAVAANSTKWGTVSGNATSEPVLDTECKWTATNIGSVVSTLSIHSHNFTGTVGWTLANTVGLNTVVLGIGKTGSANKAAFLKLLDTTPQVLQASMTAVTGHIDWCTYLDTGTFDEGSDKTGIMTLTIAKTA